ncbi:MAG: hypothetical protein A2992_01340 [Elusimicrobia bacterium RIFCSPLOWO2_01_FULL_59_12]|nr:MAG: hypothetical protein A2992_01340 [Elusimicrobia bacterium RIFCSPLOWO2_01_FULL_59_12]
MDPDSGSSLSHSQDLPAGRQDQELGKFIIDGTDTLLEPGKPLPDTYGDNCLVIMPRDPLCLFAYWEATADRLDALRDQAGRETWQTGQATLRVYDVTGAGEGLDRASRFFDIAISYDARRWYIHVPEPGRNWVVELGFKFPDGRFLVLLRSNRIALPGGAVSSQTDSRWMIVNMEAWEKMFEVTPHSAGSAEVAKMMAQRWEFLKSVFSGSSSWKKDI